MLVPENQQQSTTPKYAVSLYLATSGIGGHLMGSDEKEIIYLVFGIVDIQNKEIIGIKQYFVRPVGLQYSKNTSSTPNTSATSSESGSIPSTSYIEPLIPEAILQSAGKSLNDVINEFDSYLRSLKIDQNNICLVTDGQLPLRQCLHPEAVTKDIHLPAYYWKFSDLKKDYVKSSSQDLLRPSNNNNNINNNNNNNNNINNNNNSSNNNDVSKLPNLQPASHPAPIALTEMLNELELQSYTESDFFIKESRDMITIVQSMIIAGHSFETSEIINQSLEPGICSIDDEIDGNCIVRARGLPWQSSDQDIAKFFRGLNVAKGGVALCLSPQGRRNGEALIRFISKEHRDMALKRHKHHIGSRYIEVYPASGEDFLSVAGGASNEARTFLSKGTQVIIRMRGLPYDCTPQQVLDFFANGENSCKVLDDSEGILFVKKPDGRSTGDAFVLFADESDAPKALSKHRESIGQRYIELFRTTISEVQQVLNRSMDPKTYEQGSSKPPLIAQIPTQMSQIPLLPQHVITSGTEKNCIRLRGLPYEAKVEHILHFLEDFAKHIVYQGVHLVYNAQGQFNGEAFIQMDSESAAAASAQQKHHKHMMFGKKQRYIEVFQCSGEDMNMVLNGGGFQYQSPPAIASKPIPSSGMLPSRPAQQAQPLQISIPPPLTLSIPSSAVSGSAVLPNGVTGTNPVATVTSGNQNTTSSLIAQQQQAHFIAQQSLIARQQQAAAAHQIQTVAQQQTAADQMALFQNFGFLQSNPNQHQQALQQNPYPFQFQATPQMPLYFLPPRPMLPMSLMHQNVLGQMQYSGIPANYGIPTLQSSGQMAQTIQSTANLSNAGKRSYENAFRNENINAPSAKRVYNPNQAPGNALIAPPPTQYPPPPFNQMIQPPTPPGASLFPPQIFYWGYPNGPISPTYFGPLQIPPHAFTPHFTHDRPPTLLAVGDAQSQMIDESSVDMQKSTITNEIQYNNNNGTNAIPNHLKLTANFNFHVDEQGNIGRVDVSKAFYQNQEQVIAKNVVVMKKTPIMMTSSPNGEPHYVDCNNNLNTPTIIEAGHMTSSQPPPPPIFSNKHFPPPPTPTHPMSPLNISIHPPQFVNHLNWNHAAQYQ